MNSGMNAAQLAQLQRQLAAQQQQQQQHHHQQNNPMMANAFGGLGGNQQQQQQQQLQQALFQQQGMMNQQRSSTPNLGGGGAGMNNMNAMLLQQQQHQHQQQQQQQGGSNNSNAFWNQTAGGAMDASQASGAQLAALAGINMAGGGAGGGGGNNVMNNNSNNSSNAGNMMNPAHQMLLGQRSSSITSQPQQSSQHMQQQNQQHNALLGNLGGGSNNSAGSSSNNNNSNMAQLFQQQQQQQHQGMNGGVGGGGGGGGGMGQTNDAAMLQQQIAQLQRQLQQQQQQQQQGAQNTPQQQQQQQHSQNQMGFNNMGDNSSNNNFSMQQQQQQPQQQMFNQMMNNNSNSNNNNMLGDSSQQGSQSGGNDRFSMLMQGGQSASNQGSNNQDGMMQQQQQNLMRGSSTSQSFQNDAQKVQEMLRRQQQQQQQQQNVNSYDLDGSMSSTQQRRRQQQLQQQLQPSAIGGQPMGDGSQMGNNSSSGVAGGDDPNKSYLDGSFVGGWQSNADLPDRRRIIFSILEVIRQMRPDTNKISEKLPHMAKSLEEHLYRSAQSKEEYLDQSTLKKRLQLIAHGLEVHRTSSSNSVQSMGSNSNNNMMQSQQPGNSMGNNGSGIPGMINNGMGDQNQMGVMQNLSSNSSLQEPVNDRIAAQKKKVIRQQQQRLLLLRHASKCKLGSACPTKFCDQMTTLWKHMKKCRDKNCKVSHCLSSRCVLNHYRICKSQGRTATCEVCGPVMEQIKRQDANEALDSSDPLAARPDQDLQSQMGDVGTMERMSVFGSSDVQQNAQMAQQQAMQQLYQQQQQAIQKNQQGDSGNQTQPNFGMGDELSASNSNPQQGSGSNPQQQLQTMQQKLRQQQEVLKQLKKQQAQLLEQQRQLQEQQQQGQQGQQFQQQHALLQQLQQRCQQQQNLIQQELMMTMKGIQQQQQQQQGGSAGSQVLGNSSQQSHHSQSSNLSHHSQQGQNVQANQMQQQQQQQVDSMQASSMNQSQDGMFGNNQLTDNLQTQSAVNPMDAQLPNPMDPLSISNNENDVGNNDLSDEPLQSQLEDPNVIVPNEDKDEAPEQPQPQPQPEQNPSSTEESASDQNPSSNNAGESHGQAAANDGSDDEAADEKDESPATATPVSRAKPAGRGGKGKRLRDIADDLGENPSMDLETAARKRLANEISGRNDSEEAANKAARNDSGPAPDMETSGGNMDEGPSGAANMQKGDVEQHLLMLHKGLHLTSRTITNKCLPIVQQLIDDPYGWVFRDAVDPVVFGLPDYFEVVKNPMHLLLVKKKLENAVYTDMASFERDVKLVFENAILYNGEESEVGQLARTMLGVFEKEYKKVCEDLHGELVPVSPDACKLCGSGTLHLEPPVLYCSGESCGMSRIKRSATYFQDPQNQNFWCRPCYNQLKKVDKILLDDGTEINKSELLYAKLDTLPEEPFVKCHDCDGRFHKVCALANSRKIRSKSPFRCPKCVLVRRSVDKESEEIENPESAKNLPRCKMSDFIEAGLLTSLDEAYSKVALAEGKTLTDIEKATGLSVRVLSHVRKKHSVRDEMYKRYSKHGCPEGFPVHTKCIGLFQSRGGLDVLLFVMYVYEYGQESPSSNRRRVYISYLDSVKYFQPKRFRTVAYQSLIVEYLRWVKQRGFTTAHIWSCPPAPGDEYVFHCHPRTQKVPKEEMLRNWYVSCLETAKEKGIVVETTDYFTEYFKDHGENAPTGSAPDPTHLPYFEGDYIPGEIESVIANAVKEEEISSNKGQRFTSKDPALRRPTSGLRSGTRSNPGQLVNQVQDKIMNRLGIAIFNMKENLIIARLRSKEFCAAVERGDDVSEWSDDEDYRVNCEGKDSSLPNSKVQQDSVEEAKTSDVDNDKAPTVTPSDVLDTVDDIALDVAARNVAKIGSTVDEDEQFESEMFESRQLFLNYCQSNHCQFDEMRRAKHSSMMVLYQLHNPSAPKYVQVCATCECDISAGYRYHCIVCTNFDLCQDCYQPVVSGAWRRRGKQFIHDTSHTFSRINVAASAQAKQGQQVDQERIKVLQGYLEVLVHAAKCDGPSSGCQSNNCAKMKQLIVHVQTCDVKHSGGCRICARLLSLIIVHARTCTTRGDGCPLPFCDKIRERNERLRRQQMFMDDRRRQCQNAYYQSGD